MTKSKSTKRALLMSGLALFACISMLVGSTFAWFTDNVVSANNIIKSGNLDIVLEYWDGDSWEDVSGKDDILTNELFEPGVVEVAYLRLANAGSLALKYQLGVNIVNEDPGTNVYGNEFNLSDYIYFGVVDGVNGETSAYADRKAAVAALNGAKEIKYGYTKAASLEAGTGYQYLALVVYMPEDVDNKANHNGIDIPQIDLGINVYATQYTSESDSFDKYYDGAAVWYGGVDYSWYLENPDATEYVINTPEELAGLAAIVNGTAAPKARTTANLQDDFAGQTIKLGGNINLNEIAWTPIGNWDNAFEGIFDGNGYTISNLAINDPAGKGVGFFGVVAGATIKGLTLKNVDINAYSMVAALVGAAYPATISDCHVTGEIDIVAEWAYVAGIAGYCYYGTQVDGCSTIAEGTGAITSKTRNAVGGITAWLLEGNHNVTNCSVKNLNLTGWTNVGGITGFVHYNNTISGCSVEDVNLIKTRVDGNPGIGLIAGGYSYSANNAITLKDNSVNNVSLSGNHIAYASYNQLYGSEYGGDTDANFVLENNVAENITNNLVEVVQASDAGALDTALNNGENVVLSCNLLFSSSDTTANSGYGATGVSVEGSVLDGNGYSLGINNWDTWDAAINITAGTIKNLTVNSGMRGIFINHNDTTAGKVYLENVIIDGTIYTISCDQGTNSGLEAKDSTFNGWTSYAATIGDVLFTDCSFGEGQGYAFCRPYAPTTFVGCDFEAGYKIDARAAVTFENCTIGGVALTAENLATLVTSNIANATVK